MPAPGVYLSGVLNMTGDHMGLEIEAGSVLRSHVSTADWPQATTVPDGPVGGHHKLTAQPFIFSHASGLSDLCFVWGSPHTKPGAETPPPPN